MTNDNFSDFSPAEERVLTAMGDRREGDFERFSGLEGEAAYRLFGHDQPRSFHYRGAEVSCQAFRLADDDKGDVLVLRMNTGGKA